MSRNYHGYEVGDSIHGRVILKLGWDRKQHKALFKLQCPTCRHIATCVYNHAHKKCRLCFLNSKREKFHHRASM